MHSVLSRMIVAEASHVAMCGSGVNVSVRLLHRSSRMCFKRSPKKDKDEKASCTGPPFKLSISLCEDPQIIAIVKSIMSLEADEVDNLNKLLRSAVQQEEEEVRYYENKVEQALAKTLKKEKNIKNETSGIKDMQSHVDAVAAQTLNEQQTNESALPEPDHDLNEKKTAVIARKPSLDKDKKCDAALDSLPFKAPGKELNKRPRTLIIVDHSQEAESHTKSSPLELGKKSFKTVIKTAETQEKKSSEESANTDQPNLNSLKDIGNMTLRRTIKGSGFILKKPASQKAKEETNVVIKEAQKSMEAVEKERRAKQVKKDYATAAQSDKISKDSVEFKKESVKSKVIDQANINFAKDVIRLKPKRIFNLSLSKKKAESTVENKIAQQPIVKPQIKKNESELGAKCTNGWWFWQKSSDDKDPSDKK